MDNSHQNTYLYLVTIAYDGSNFWGWAKQPHKFTVQGHIEEVISRVFRAKINILASSRTDKGVHAHEQKFTLRLPFCLAGKNLFNLLRKQLGEHIAVKKVQKVDEDFHPIKKVISKEYRYFINIGQPNIWQKKYCWDYNLPLKPTKLNEILQLFQGQHDFFNYCHCRYQDRRKTNTMREIFSLKSWRRKNLVIISIIAPGFLRYQIRAIIGEVINCYEGKQTIVDLKERLISGNKYKNLAPAAGLYLWKIKTF